MKKKVKLLATIGSLCLAIAMMTIGVIAAATQTLEVTSSVSFTTSTVLADFTGTVTGAVEGTKTYAGYTADPTDPTAQPTAWTIGALTFSETNKTITYTINVTNKSNFAVDFAVTGAPEAIEGQLEVTETGETATLEKGSQAHTYTLVLTLKSFSGDLGTTPVNLNVAVTKPAT